MNALFGGLVAACAALATAPLFAATMTLEGTVIAPQEQGDPFVLKLPSPKVFSGDADCGRQQQAEIHLWDQGSKFRPYVGKSVTVTGQIDCPRGGYVLRNVTFGSGAMQSSVLEQPAQLSQRSSNKALVRLLLCSAQDRSETTIHLFGDGLYLESVIGASNGRKMVVMQTAGQYSSSGDLYQLRRLGSRLPIPGAQWDNLVQQQILETVRIGPVQDSGGTKYVRLENLEFKKAGVSKPSNMVRVCLVGELNNRALSEAADMRNPTPPGF